MRNSWQLLAIAALMTLSTALPIVRLTDDQAKAKGAVCLDG